MMKDQLVEVPDLEELYSVEEVEFDRFNSPEGQPISKREESLLAMIDANLSISLGEVKLPVLDVLKLEEGSSVIIDSKALVEAEILLAGRRVAIGRISKSQDRLEFKIEKILELGNHIERQTGSVHEDYNESIGDDGFSLRA